MDVRIRNWADSRYLFTGPPEDIPDEYRELVALIDASDDGAVLGVGCCHTYRADGFKVYVLGRAR
jgi:hypothetical protein